MQHVLDVMTYYVEEQIQELEFINSMDIKVSGKWPQVMVKTLRLQIETRA